MFMTKKRRPDEFAKECIIRHSSGRLMDYDPESRTLFLSENKKYFHVFPSRTQANLAMHHQISLDKSAGKFEPWNDYEIIET